jgi:hypothetical protein
VIGNDHPGTAIATHPTHIYARPGNDAITVTQTDSAGGSSTQNRTIKITTPTPKRHHTTTATTRRRRR